jgi:hypothetical protein
MSPPSLSPVREGLTGGTFERETEGDGDGEVFGVSDVTPGRGADLGTLFPFIVPGVKTDCRGDNISEDGGANIDSRGEREGEVGAGTGMDEEGEGEGEEVRESTGVLLKPGED